MSGDPLSIAERRAIRDGNPIRGLHREEVDRYEATALAMTEVIDSWADHDSWRCYSTRYPDECCCGLNDALVKAGLPARILPSGSR